MLRVSDVIDRGVCESNPLFGFTVTKIPFPLKPKKVPFSGPVEEIRQQITMNLKKRKKKKTTIKTLINVAFMGHLGILGWLS